ncbi:MAG: hypothetical protein HC831_13445 [Chloroflexia bacterium]|nr:hypothetical protein [Chloroflexia bacterium]
MGPYGGTPSKHTREKLSKAHTGKKRIFSEEHKRKLSAATKKWHAEVSHSEETRKRMSEKNRGWKASENR